VTSFNKLPYDIAHLAPRFVISLRSFSQWLTTPEATQTLGGHLLQLHDISPHSPLGYEIPVSPGEIADWVKTLQQNENAQSQILPGKYAQLPRKLQSDIIKSEISSIHLPPFGRLTPGQEEWFACMIAEIWRLTGITSFSIRPEGSTYEQWDVLLTMLPEKIILAVENASREMNNFQTLDEITRLLAEFPRLKLNFNIAHWLELRNSLNDSTLLGHLTKKRPHRIKLSLPSNHRELRTIYQSDRDFPLHTSNHSLPESFLGLCQSVPVVITGTIPHGKIDVLLEEIKHIENLCAGTELSAA
jgi:hypothetical protein